LLSIQLVKNVNNFDIKLQAPNNKKQINYNDQKYKFKTKNLWFRRTNVSIC